MASMAPLDTSMGLQDEDDSIVEDLELTPEQRLQKLSPTYLSQKEEGLMGSDHSSSPMQIVIKKTEQFIEGNEILNANAFNSTS